ncbi:MAG: dynamin family protein [Pseudomonadota bacterium]|nr:dynamin family protein [Pseudomonadota bacterium]
MPSAIAESLDSLAAWRAALDREMAALGRSLLDHELLDDADAAVLHALRERLAADKLVLAFVAEFSRGKSELINAIFFADAGRRVLPATPGRTTMCPVELRHDDHLPPRLALLPIETRLRGLSLTELRPRENEWRQVALDPGNADSLADALAAVTQTQRVSVEAAAKLGLWNEAQPDDNPQQAADGSVEVPAWRHAVINYPHPLLQRGLVVMDTPGLNAVGAEPELTLGLLPSAHAVVFVLAADTGVTKSDLAIWRDHLGQASLERFVVLNKIDTLADPLLTVEAVQAQIEQQCVVAASVLKVPRERVFALSAREALSARVGQSNAGLLHSRLPPLEQALALELLPRRRELLVASAVGTIEHLRASGSRRLADRRRLQTEQLLELRSLRGKSVGKLRTMLERIDAEITEFERCTVRIAALRSVQQRVLRGVLQGLSSDALRKELVTLQSPGILRSFSVGGRTAFDALMVRLRQTVATALAQADELRQMFEGSFRELNSDYGFSLVLPPLPSLAAFDMELHLIGRNYSRYLGIGQAWRMAAPGFAEQFRRMLLSKLRVCFESAAGEVELWSKAALTQIEVQLRERRRGFVRRRESLQRVQSASGELEQRIAEVQTHDAQIDQMQNRLDRLVAQAISSARGLTHVQPDSGADEHGYAPTAPADLQQLRLRAPA